MIGRRWVQTGGAAGILSFVLVALSFIVNSPNSPDSDAAVKDIVAFLNANRNGIIVADVLVIAAAVVILWYGATLSRLMGERDETSPLGTVMLGSSAAMSVLFIWDGLSLTLLAFLSKQSGGLSDQSTVRALYDLFNGIVMPGGFGFVAAIFLTAVGLGMVRGKFASRWLGHLSLVFAPVSIAGGVLGLTQTTGGTSSPVSFSPAIGSMTIVLLSSIYMLRYRASA
jgi:hypothetical protein